MGEMGGVFEFIIGTVNVLLAPWLQYVFTLKAIEKLYYAKTKDDSLFEPTME